VARGWQDLRTVGAARIAESDFLRRTPTNVGLFSAATILQPMPFVQIKSFHDLQVWRLSMQMTTDVYCLVRQLPAEERFGLSLQMRRATISIPSNIAEGFGYGRSRRNIHHLRIALGSDLELQTHLMLIERLRLATPDQVQPLLDRASEVGRMLNGLIKSLERHQTAPKTTE
jgi:four helix bundle protein